MEAYCDARLDALVEGQRVGQAEQAEEGHAEAGGGAGSARELAPWAMPAIPLDITPAIPLDITPTPGSAGEGARAGASGLEVAAAAGGQACLLLEHAHCCRWEAGGGRR